MYQPLILYMKIESFYQVAGNLNFVILRSVKKVVRKCKTRVEGTPYNNETHRLFHFDCTHGNSGFV